MNKSRITALLLAALLISVSVLAGTPFNKCSVNGSVTYQSTPCPSNEVRPRPTVEQLNAERQKKLNQQKEQAARSPSTSSTDPRQQPGDVAPRASETIQTDRGERQKNSPAPAGLSFKCDGRKYCSQMTSCAEARYFLASCPGVKMDGDRNGVPCEKQWCNR